MPLKRLNVNNLASPDLELEIGETVYVIRGALTVQETVELLNAEQALVQSSADETGKAAIEATEMSQKLLLRLIRERYPDAAEPQLTMFQSGRILSYIASGGEVGADEMPLAVEQTVAETLHEGITDEDEQRLAQLPSEPGMNGDGQVEDVVPLASPNGSHNGSSISDERIVGTPNGGEHVPGRRSGSTSETETVV